LVRGIGGLINPLTLALSLWARELTSFSLREKVGMRGSKVANPNDLAVLAS
jgi:hypothetical protein